MAITIISAPPPLVVSGSTSRTFSHWTRQRCAHSRWLRRHHLDHHHLHHVNRFDRINSRCWMKNKDKQVNHGVDNEEDHEDATAAVSSCFTPAVPINSDTSEHRTARLVADADYLDGVLIPLPALLDVDQRMPLAPPAHPDGLYALYTNFLVGNMVEQLWNYAWPAAIALVHPSLLPVAVISFCTKLAIIIGGPLVGKLMDHFPRLPTYNCLSFVQVSAQLVSVAMIILAHRSPPMSAVLVQPWFIVLVLMEAVERLSGLALGVAVERDWVVLLAGPERSVALARANAVLSRIDLLSEAGATGLILQASLLFVAVVAYFAGSISSKKSIIFFLCLIVLSRLGHMSYDIVGAQILQTGIPSSKANLIGITEVSVTSLAELVMLGVAIVAKDASKFPILAMLSLSSVVAAAWMFCRWLNNPTDEQKNLFS